MTKISYICSRIVSESVSLGVKACLRKNGHSVPLHTPGLVLDTVLHREGGVGNGAQHNEKGVYLALCLRLMGISQIH